eukprot:365052-Chlamydomonas_euryale.AAC.40
MPGLCAHITCAGSCVGKIPKRFFSVTRSRLNLSSGENRAGCADLVGSPFGSVFCDGAQLYGGASEMHARPNGRRHAWRALTH